MTATRPPRDSWFAGLVSVLTTTLVLAVLALAVALAVVPRALDGAALTVLTGSMVPTYDPGDMVVVRGVHDARAEIQEGDVVSFQPLPDDPTLVTHRVVDVRSTSEGLLYVTRGDANGADDDPITGVQIKGEVVYHVPYVGHAALALGQHRSTAILAVAVALLAYGAFMVLRPERRDRTPADATADAAPGAPAGGTVPADALADAPPADAARPPATAAASGATP